MKYDTNVDICGIKIDSYLFENNRVCFVSDANFHIFYNLVHGAPKHLREELFLEYNSFSVSLKTQKSS